MDVGKTGSLDFGDLAVGSSKALPLKLVNRTHATVPIRLVVSAVSEILRTWFCNLFKLCENKQIQGQMLCVILEFLSSAECLSMALF